jgi:hypothetical protein
MYNHKVTLHRSGLLNLLLLTLHLVTCSEALHATLLLMPFCKARDREAKHQVLQCPESPATLLPLLLAAANITSSAVPKETGLFHASRKVT